jgi:sulfur carrier protein
MTTETTDVVVNGETETVPAGITVAALVTERTDGGRGVAVARNGEVVPRGLWADVTVDGGDQIEILTAAQGG